MVDDEDTERGEGLLTYILTPIITTMETAQFQREQKFAKCELISIWPTFGSIIDLLFNHILCSRTTDATSSQSCHRFQTCS